MSFHNESRAADDPVIFAPDARLPRSKIRLWTQASLLEKFCFLPSLPEP